MTNLRRSHTTQPNRQREQVVAGRCAEKILALGGAVEVTAATDQPADAKAQSYTPGLRSAWPEVPSGVAQPAFLTMSERPYVQPLISTLP